MPDRNNTKQQKTDMQCAGINTADSGSEKNKISGINRELQIAERRYRGVVETQSEMIARFTGSGKITFVNSAWKKYYNSYLGIQGDVLGRNLEDFMQIPNFDEVFKYLHSIKPGDISKTLERSFTALDGQTRWQQWYVHRVTEEDYDNTEFQAVGIDITERKNAEIALSKSEARFKSLIELAPDAILLGSPGGFIMEANRQASELTGYSNEELICKNINILFSPEEIRNVPLRYDLLMKGYTVRNERNLTRNDRSTVLIEMNTMRMPDGTYQAFIRDISEKQKFLDSFIQSDKLNALAIMAGGIAHDFNNLLSGIFGYIELARSGEDLSPETADYLDKAFTVFERAKNLTQQLLTFSKGGEPVRKAGDLGKVLIDNSRFALSGSQVSCVYDIAGDLWHCDFDENQISQVIDNIIINAKQAMNGSGIISVRAENTVVGENKVDNLPSGKYVRFSVTDKGKGISTEQLKQIFDPFFTTKKSGTGLGLATSYSIIQKHGGLIKAVSAQGKGTEIIVFLPASEISAENIREKETDYHISSGLAVIMDDESFMREIISSYIESMGYTAVYAKDGAETVEIIENAVNEGKTIEFAIFDLTIPGGMGGAEAVNRVREILPDLKIFASSGFSDDNIMSNPSEYGFNDSIRKPFRREELSSLLKKHFS